MGHPLRRERRVGVVITSLKGDTLKYGVQLNFPVTNNEAEYETILIGLKIAQAKERFTARYRASQWRFRSNGVKDAKIFGVDESINWQV